MNYNIILFLLAIFAPLFFAAMLDRRKQERERKEAEIYNEVHSRAISHKPSGPAKPPKKPSTKKAAQIDPETVAALYAQADAELTYADAIDRKARAESDPVKQAAFFKRAAASRTKAQQLSFKAYTLESPD